MTIKYTTPTLNDITTKEIRGYEESKKRQDKRDNQDEGYVVDHSPLTQRPFANLVLK